MATSVRTIRGVTPALAAKLKERNIDNTDELLAVTRTRAARRALASAVGVTEVVIREIVQRADLARIHGVGDALADLLEESGVDTPKELRRRRPDNLHTKMVEVNMAQKLVARVPPREEVGDWIEQAKTLEDLIEYGAPSVRLPATATQNPELVAGNPEIF